MKDDVKSLENFVTKYNSLKNEISKVIVGQEHVVSQVLISIFSNGHCLLVGVPGLAKTLLVNTLSKTLGLDFNRIQFTPDLMPSDIVGSEILDIEAYNQFEEAEIVSLKNHAFFVACGFCPQISSTREVPHPIIYTFLKASKVYNEKS